MIEFTEQEQRVISQFSVIGGWDHEDCGPLKRRIKPCLLAHTSKCCCYCRRSMRDWHGLTIDIEHVLPKRKFPQFTFELRNLSVSCKRCNMTIKGEDTSYYLGRADEADPFYSHLYNIIHPNLDRTNDHLSFLTAQMNQHIMVKYYVVNESAKDIATYGYFELGDLEVNSFDGAQGMDDTRPSESLPPTIARELHAVLQNVEGSIRNNDS